MTIDAIFFCHKEPAATYRALETFRRHVGGHVHLISDACYNYSRMAAHFGHTYIHLPETLVMNNSRFDELLGLMEWVFRRSKADYVMMLEDDVVIQGPIDESVLRGTINGPKVNVVPAYFFEKYADLMPPGGVGDRRYSGHGGCLFHRQTFLDCLKRREELLPFDFSFWGANVKQTMGDVFYSLLVLLCGHTIEENPQHLEYHYAPHMASRAAIVHQMKDLYGQKLAPELAHLVTN